MIERQACARAGLLGNPSDGYFGKTLAIAVKNFTARVILEPSETLEILPSEPDSPVYGSLQDLIDKVELYGYYGGVRLLKAAIKTFHAYCDEAGIELAAGNFRMHYESTIPRQLGLGGSSAIITAAFRALTAYFSVEIPKPRLPSLILDAELQELGINAGFMDRVVQVYEGCVFMDLERSHIEEHGYGRYQSLDPALLPRLYLAYKPELGKVSGRVLSDIRTGFDRGDPEVLNTLMRIAELADRGKLALQQRDHERFFAYMNENFDLRSRIMRISPSNQNLIQAARDCGASAKFAGSGGSIIGMYEDENVYHRLEKELGKLGAVVIKPVIA